jgi:hypothetical protein
MKDMKIIAFSIGNENGITKQIKAQMTRSENLEFFRRVLSRVHQNPYVYLIVKEQLDD